MNESSTTLSVLYPQKKMDHTDLVEVVERTIFKYFRLIAFHNFRENQKRNNTF